MYIRDIVCVFVGGIGFSELCFSQERVETLEAEVTGKTKLELKLQSLQEVICHTFTIIIPS